MSRGTLACVALAGLLLVTAHRARLAGSVVLAQQEAASDSQTAPEEEATDPLGPNAACYVCHIPFVREELSKRHLRAKITCVKCHGSSTKHVNDERIGATKPDITYKRDKVNASCRRCHKRHDAAPEKVVARWLERRLSKSPPACTDCHGMHRMQPSRERKEAQDG